MDKKLWFKAKRYGWGWTPSSWQGWLVLVVYLAAACSVFRYTDMTSHSGSDTLIGFFLPFIGLTTLLLVVCYLKGEKPGWHWGK